MLLANVQGQDGKWVSGLDIFSPSNFPFVTLLFLVTHTETFITYAPGTIQGTFMSDDLLSSGKTMITGASSTIMSNAWHVKQNIKPVLLRS